MIALAGDALDDAVLNITDFHQGVVSVALEVKKAKRQVAVDGCQKTQR
jgi:hypothetical protein